jgi:branched-chain amino acid aminotransferase
MLVTINGQPPRLSVEAIVTSTAFNYGYGVFETMRAQKGNVFLLNEHLDRLEHSAKVIGLKLPKATSTIKKYLESTVDQLNMSPIRVKLIATDTDIIIIATKLETDNSLYKGVKCVTAVLRRQFPNAKTLHYLDSYLAHQYALQNNAYEALLVNENGHITEGAYSNFFAIKHGRLYTPNKNILLGITRQAVIDIAQEEKMPVLYRGILPSEAEQIDEAFITQSTRGIVPVIQLDDTKIGGGHIRPFTKKLMSLYKEKVSQSCS